MNQTELSAEHFKAVQELATIGAQVSVLRSEISTLKSDKEHFLRMREDETHARIQKVLDDSTAQLNAIGEHHADLQTYAREITSYVQSIRELHQEVVAASTDLRARLDRSAVALERRETAIVDRNTEIVIAQKNLALDRAQLQRERDLISDEYRRIKDERQTLSKAWSELETRK